MVRLEKITEQNVYKCLGLQVNDAQKNFVAPNTYSLAEAWVYGDVARPFAIYDGDTLVGFFMGSVDKEKQEYGVWRLMIDKRYQGKGYGRAALRLAVAYLRGEGAGAISLSYEPENTTAGALYASEGFVLTGEVDDGEVVARLDLKA